MTAVLAAVVFAVGGNHLVERTRASPAEVEAQLRLLTRGSDADREAAAKWFSRNARAWAVRAAVPALERAAVYDPTYTVRASCLIALGKSAAADGKRMPAVLLDCVYDEYGWPFGTIYWPRFAPFDQQCVSALIRFAQSDNPGHREHAASLLAEYAGHSPDAVKVLRGLTTDPQYWVRQSAHGSIFRLTNKLVDYLPHPVMLEAELFDAPPLKPDAPDEEQVERSRRVLAWFAFQVAQAGWLEDRAAEMREALLGMVKDDNPKVRLAAVSYLARTGMILTGRLPADPPLPKGTDPALFNGPDAPLKHDPKKQQAGREVIVRSAAIQDRLKVLAEKDPDAAVRKQAGLALWVLKDEDRDK